MHNYYATTILNIPSMNTTTMHRRCIAKKIDHQSTHTIEGRGRKTAHAQHNKIDDQASDGEREKGKKSSVQPTTFSKKIHQGSTNQRVTDTRARENITSETSQERTG